MEVALDVIRKVRLVILCRFVYEKVMHELCILLIKAEAPQSGRDA